jgi:hypothetical protein
MDGATGRCNPVRRKRTPGLVPGVFQCLEGASRAWAIGIASRQSGFDAPWPVLSVQYCSCRAFFESGRRDGDDHVTRSNAKLLKVSNIDHRLETPEVHDGSVTAPDPASIGD